MRTLIFADDVLIWGKDEKGAEEKLNWNLIIKELRPKMNMDKLVTMKV
jgi:hypothetical protein